jgi:hypothetical protein
MNSFEIDNTHSKLVRREDDSAFEGGSNTDSSSSVTDLDDLEQTQKEFYEDFNNSQGGPRYFRLLLWLSIIGLNLSLLVIYSLEGIHNTTGSLVWVLAFFAAQLLSFLVVTPLYLFAHSSWVASAYWHSQGDDE